MDGCWFYILRCADGSYYIGTSRSEDLETRISQHNQGTFGGCTAKRRPVVLVYSAHLDNIVDAIGYERQVKGWSRARKEALIRGDFEALQDLSKSRRSSRKAPNESNKNQTPRHYQLSLILRSRVAASRKMFQSALETPRPSRRIAPQSSSG
jgi:putative endonuclease